MFCHKTLKNFEVIVVDDCSTDDSAKIVESFIPKFDGRLQIMQMPTNTGGASMPRNRGLEISRGKYIFFMDSDDLLTETALEELYNLAEKFDVEVVHCNCSYKFQDTAEQNVKRVEIGGKPLVNVPMFLDPQMIERIKLVFSGFFRVPPWLKIVRRDFLIRNQISFRQIRRDDEMWSFEVLFSAKNILLVPNVCVFYRIRGDSLTFATDRPLNKQLLKTI